MDRPAVWRTLAIDLEAERPFRIGGASVNPVSRDARYAGETERLQPQHLKVLIALVRHKGDVITRSELIDTCWGGRIVGEDVINRSISILRDFAERAGGFTIETVPKSGYRLRETAPPRSWRRRLQGMTIALVLIAGVGTWFIARPLDRTTDGETINLPPFGADAAQSPAPEVAAAARQALADTLTDQGFTVRTSPTRDADIVISGNVIRAATMVQATVKVERSSEGLALSSLTFEVPVSQSGTLPNQIGAQIAAGLSLAESYLALDRRHPSDPRITTKLLEQTNLLVNGEEPLRVYPIARKLALQAPDSPLAQMLLAMSTGQVLGELPHDERFEALAIGRKSAERAQALAPRFGDAYAPWCQLHSQARLMECEDRLRAGMHADPEAPLLPQYLSEQLAWVGRSDEALQFARIGFARERHAPSVIARLLRSLEATGHPGEAGRVYELARQWWPNYRRIFWSRLSGMLERGDFDRLEKFANEPDGVRLLRGFETPGLFAALRTGNLAEAKRECEVVSDPSLRITLCMLGLAHLGDMDGAYRIADKLYPRIVGKSPDANERLWIRQWEGPPYHYLVGPGAGPMRRDPRFLGVAERIGLLAYWRSGRLPDFCRAQPEPICSELRAQ